MTSTLTPEQIIALAEAQPLGLWTQGNFRKSGDPKTFCRLGWIAHQLGYWRDPFGPTESIVTFLKDAGIPEATCDYVINANDSDRIHPEKAFDISLRVLTDHLTRDEGGPTT
jgi:hypothetical protein